MTNPLVMRCTLYSLRWPCHASTAARIREPRVAPESLSRTVTPPNREPEPNHARPDGHSLSTRRSRRPGTRAHSGRGSTSSCFGRAVWRSVSCPACLPEMRVALGCVSPTPSSTSPRLFTALLRLRRDPARCGCTYRRETLRCTYRRERRSGSLPSGCAGSAPACLAPEPAVQPALAYGRRACCRGGAYVS
jgi:hypothetical protein